jgi:hypothetical protein
MEPESRADDVAEHGSMPSAGAHAVSHPPLDRLGPIRLIKERDVLFPWQPDHHPQVVLLGSIEQPPWRHRVAADRIDAVRGHEREVGVQFVVNGIVVAAFLRRERPVCHAADPQLLVACEHELAGHPWTIMETAWRDWASDHLRRDRRDCRAHLACVVDFDQQNIGSRAFRFRRRANPPRSCAW